MIKVVLLMKKTPPTGFGGVATGTVNRLRQRFSTVSTLSRVPA
jgi:hypothetical protein